MGHGHEGAAGEDDHLEPQTLQFSDVEQGRLAGFHKVVEQRHGGMGDHFRGLVRRPDGLHEKSVGAGFGESITASHRVVPAGDGQRVGADDDGEVVIGAGVHGGVDFLHHFVDGYHPLVFQVTAPLGKLLVFDVYRGHAGALVFADRAPHIHGAAVSGVRVGDHRHADGGSDGRRVGKHLGCRGQGQIGVADAGHRGSGSGHVDGGKVGSLDDRGGETVISAGRGNNPGLGEQLSETGGGFHRTVLASSGVFMRSARHRWSVFVR